MTGIHGGTHGLTWLRSDSALSAGQAVSRGGGCFTLKGAVRTHVGIGMGAVGLVKMIL